MTTKFADSKGRVVLGAKFANKAVIVQDIDDTEVRVIAAAVIPQRELWLHKNPRAMAAVQHGLEQARNRQFSKRAPDLKADAKLAAKLND